MRLKLKSLFAFDKKEQAAISFSLFLHFVSPFYDSSPAVGVRTACHYQPHRQIHIRSLINRNVDVQEHTLFMQVLKANVASDSSTEVNQHIL